MLKFSKYLAIFCLGIVSQLVIAQPGTFEIGIFNIPQGASMVSRPVSASNRQLIQP
jgi:hypothetical protein